MAEIESYPQSASHEVVPWPWQRRDSYGAFAAVTLVHVILILLAFRLLAPRLDDYRKIDAVMEIAADPAVNWIDNSPAPAPLAPPDTTSPPAAQRLPYAPGDSPQKDPPSQIALPPRPTAGATPDPVPPPAKDLPAPAPAPSEPPATTRILPVLTAAPAPAPPAPKAEPSPAPKKNPDPKPVAKPVAKPAPRLALAPAPAPVLEPAPPKAAVNPPPPRPEVKPAPAPVVRIKPEVVAPPPAKPSPAATPASPIAAPPGAAPARAADAPGRPSGANPGGDLSSYHRLIHDAFHSHWRQPKSLPSGSASYQTKVKITIARDGTIVGTTIVKPSGNPVMESSVWRAVQTVRRIAPLPPHIESANYSVVINFQLD